MDDFRTFVKGFLKKAEPEKNIHNLYFQFSRQHRIPVYVSRNPLVEEVAKLNSPSSVFVYDI
jgi:hypothetical protein